MNVYKNIRDNDIILIDSKSNLVKFEKEQKKTLPPFFDKYVPNYLEKTNDNPASITIEQPIAPPQLPVKTEDIQDKLKKTALLMQYSQNRAFIEQSKHTKEYDEAIKATSYPLSNGKAVGILYENNQALLAEILKNKDPRTMVFVASNDEIDIHRLDVVTLRTTDINNAKNKLAFCLSRFSEKKLFLDTEIHDYNINDIDGITYIIPIRCTGRIDAIKTVVDNIKGQRYPFIEIIISENDSESRGNFDNSVKYVFTKNDGQFNKAVAFNAAVKLASFDKIVLHDADILVPWCYTLDVFDKLNKHDGLHLGKHVYYLTNPSTARISKQGEIADNCIVERRVDYFEGGSVACKFNTFVEIGGFNEDFKGYGNEDTDFYSRLSNYGNFCDQRTYNFIHLWHGRAEGWVACYDKNKELEATLNSMPMTNRTKELRNKLLQSGYSKR